MPTGQLIVLIYIIAAFVAFAATLAWVSRTAIPRRRRSGRLFHKHGTAAEHR